MRCPAYAYERWHFWKLPVAETLLFREVTYLFMFIQLITNRKPSNRPSQGEIKHRRSAKRFEKQQCVFATHIIYEACVLHGNQCRVSLDINIGDFHVVCKVCCWVICLVLVLFTGPEMGIGHNKNVAYCSIPSMLDRSHPRFLFFNRTQTLSNNYNL